MNTAKYIIDKYKDTSLSNYEIYNLLKKTTKVLIYPELWKYHNIYDVLKPHGSFVLLYMTAESYGHLVCVIDHGTHIEFFDPYGNASPDEQLAKVPNKLKKKTKQDFPYLLYLLYKSGAPIEYNDHPFQKHGNRIKTCGRQVIARLLYRSLTLEEYNHLMKKISKLTGLSFDDIVTLITMDLK
jgi:hypothetical protein